MDRVVSTRGRQLIVCIQSGLRIINGRILGDSLGKYTSFQPLGSSVIDFFYSLRVTIKTYSRF